jgi:flagellar biosynthesis chaperone FliJ
MRRLEEDKKKTDQAKIKEYTQQIEDYQKQLQELEYERINQLGGIAGGDAVKSASENFVNAWIDAFKETGDGLSGLEEQFDEVFTNLVKKQVLGRGVDKMLEPLYKTLEGMLYDGAMDAQEYEDFNKQWNTLSPQINEFLTKMVNDLGIADDITKKTGELSGLQSGIQGITEDQADILAAYWSSVRFIVSNIEQKFTEYARQMLGSDANANPILGELKEHTRILNDIDDKLGSIIGYSGGAHVKTYLMSQ